MMPEAEQAEQTILVVDDEADGLEAVASRLERYRSYQVYRAASSDEALALAADVDFDLVVTDVRMPGRDGIETLVEMQRLNPEVSCVIITGYADDEAPLRALRVGAREFLYKPVSPQRLLDTVDRLVEQVRARRQASQLRADLQRDGTRFEQVGRILQELARAWSRCGAATWPDLFLPLACRLTGAHEAALFHVQAQTDTLRPAPGSCVEGEDIPTNGGYVGRGLGAGESAWVAAPQSPPGLPFEVAHQNLMVLPLHDGQRVVGVLEVFDCAAQPGHSDLALVQHCGEFLSRVATSHAHADRLLARALKLAPPAAPAPEHAGGLPSGEARAGEPALADDRTALEALERIAQHGRQAQTHAADLLAWFAAVLEQQTGRTD